MKKTTLGAIATGVFLMGASSSAQAGECGYQQCWGAVAFGPSGKISYAYGLWSERAAYRKAVKSCKGACSEVRTFYNECAAVSRGADWKWSWSKAPTRRLAESRANAACSSTSSDCKVIVWACSR